MLGKEINVSVGGGGEKVLIPLFETKLLFVFNMSKFCMQTKLLSFFPQHFQLSCMLFKTKLLLRFFFPSVPQIPNFVLCFRTKTSADF